MNTIMNMRRRNLRKGVAGRIRLSNMSRRHFLMGAAGTGGFVLGLTLFPIQKNPAAAAGGVFEPSVFLSIAKDGTTTIMCHRSEMGQGIRTGLPIVLADELEADLSRCVIVQAEGDAKYGDQYTDGSHSIVEFYDQMRELGAAGRQMLEQAAAQQWGVAQSECKAQNHKVVHQPTGKSLDFGDLAATAATLEVPAADTLRLKDSKDFRYVGKDTPIVDLKDINQGSATYTIDITMPGMKYASVERCPVTLGKVKSYDASEALKVPGVEAVVEIPPFSLPVVYNALGGIAVVASNTWAAMEGRKKLKITWDYGENAGYESRAYRKSLEESARNKGDVWREEGDVNAAFGSAHRILEAEYYSPLLVHVPMEPPGAVAHVQGDKCLVWSSTQDPQSARDVVAEAIGLDSANVESRMPLLGGAFGRKSKPDFAAEAAVCSKEVGAPVKVTWTREDDVRNGFYHSDCAQHVKAALDANGKVTAWEHRSAFPTINWLWDAAENRPGAWEIDFGLSDLPYDIPNISIEGCEAPVHVRVGWLRSVHNIFHAFAIGSFADEIAYARGRDPVDNLLDLIGPARIIDLSGNPEEYFNYMFGIDKYPIDTGRLIKVVKEAAKMSKWGRSLPSRHGLGIMAHRSFLTYVATVVEVAVADDGTISIPNVYMAVDCGLAVNTDRVRSQMEGATIYGMSAACYGEITAKAGRIQQHNFNDYHVVRMSDCPRDIHVHILQNLDAPPGGVGEPGVPPFAPALYNAVFAATGKRLRSLPLQNHDLSI